MFAGRRVLGLVTLLDVWLGCVCVWFVRCGLSVKCVALLASGCGPSGAVSATVSGAIGDMNNVFLSLGDLDVTGTDGTPSMCTLFDYRHQLHVTCAAHSQAQASLPSSAAGTAGAATCKCLQPISARLATLVRHCGRLSRMASPSSRVAWRFAGMGLKPCDRQAFAPMACR